MTASILNRLAKCAKGGKTALTRGCLHLLKGKNPVGCYCEEQVALGCFLQKQQTPPLSGALSDVNLAEVMVEGVLGP